MPEQVSEPGTQPAPEISMPPIEWQRQKRTKWPTACLAAALSRWDPRCEDDEVVTEADYDAAVKLAEAKLAECRELAGKSADPSTARRVFVLEHPSLMHALVAVKPNVAQASAILDQMRDEDAPRQMRGEQLMNALWGERVLWPATGSNERQAVMDEMAGAYAEFYPTAYLRAFGVGGQDVRKKR